MLHNGDNGFTQTTSTYFLQTAFSITVATVLSCNSNRLVGTTQCDNNMCPGVLFVHPHSIHILFKHTLCG